MTVRMTTLRRAANGDWFSRKAIPADIRDAYRQAHGIAQEERFRRPASLSQDRAKQEMREWDAEVSARIATLRAQSRGEGRSLTQREAHALAGDWYGWFIALHEENPGDPDQWMALAQECDDARADLGEAKERQDTAELQAAKGYVDELSQVRAALSYARARMCEMARVPTFLAERGVILAPDAHSLLVDAVAREFGPACAALKRRAEGDYGRDAHAERFPAAGVVTAPRQGNSKTAGLTCWGAFEAWVRERQPAASTVDRWRSVFLALEQRFPGRDISTITDHDAIEWKDTLVTEDRSAVVVNDIWLSAARRVFGWAVENKKIKTNPFQGVRVAVAKRQVKEREREFREQEWRTILQATFAPPPPRMDAHNAAARRWVPWLCAYTGARPGEMTQLRAEDVRQEGGVWAIHIVPEAGTVKTSAARKVPLHEHLIAQGFIEFVRGRGKGPLFYEPTALRAERIDPTRPRKGPWTKQRDKLAEWVRALGIDSTGISPNHAWRHTFKRRAARAKIEPGIRDAMCGHAPRTVADEYEAPSFEDMAAAMTTFPRYALAPQTAPEQEPAHTASTTSKSDDGAKP